jgi:hypothetical protein
MLRSPLFLVGLALSATIAALCFLDGEVAQPLSRIRTEEPRSAEPARGIAPATASAEPAQRRQSEPKVADPRAGETPFDAARKRSKSKQTDSEEPAVPHCVVSGRCVRNGQPIANMDFVLAPKSGKGRRQNLRTDENGWFRRGLAGVGEFELRVVGPGLSAHQRVWNVTLAEGTPCELGDLELRPRVAIRGAATMHDGAPAAGVVVTLRDQNDAQLGVADAAADGSFVFYDVPEGELRLVATHDALLGRARLRIEGGAAEHTTGLRLRPQATITWTLRDDDGRSLANARLRATDDEIEAVADELGSVAMTAFVGSMIRVEAEGCAPTEVKVEAAQSERRVTLPRIRELRGKVDMAATGAEVRIGRAEGEAALPEFARTAAAATVLVAADGTFLVPGLVAGRYTVRVANKEGCTELRTFALPDEPFVSLPWTKGQVAELLVRDERGEPVAFARAEVAAAADAAPRAFRSDAEGRLVVPQSDLRALTLTCAGHLPTRTDAIEGSESPQAITLERATSIEGRVADFAPSAPFQFEVVAWKKGEDPRNATPLALDADGSFRSGDTKPGTWNVAVRRKDRTHKGPKDGAEPLDLPLIADGIDTRTTTVVDARGGERARVVVPMLPIPTIEGIVLRGGKPVAGATVFLAGNGAMLPGALAGNPLGFDHVAAARHCVRATTDAEGRFRAFAGRPGRYDFRVRVEGQPFATGPTQVELRAYTDVATLRLELPTAVVRGRLATASKSALAFLLRNQDAARDPFRADEGPSETQCRVSQRITEDGMFEFPCVEPGDYVLRFVVGDRIVRQRLVHVQGQPVDVGEVPEAPAAKPATLELGAAMPAGSTAVLLTRLPDVPGGAFLRRIPAQGARLKLEGVPAGPYLLVLHDGKSQVGEPQPFELRGDGATVPGRLASR